MNGYQRSRTMGWLPAFLGLAFAPLVYAQTAQLTGRIMDTSAAGMPGAQVTVTHAATGIQKEAVSNEQGYYTVPLLPPGTYQITVQRAGFRPVSRSGLELAVQQVARLDFTLELGGITEQVTVIGGAPSLETETSALGKVVDAQRIQSLPLLGRNPYALVALVPGARPSAGINDLPVDVGSTAYVSINGAPGNQNTYLLDGAPNTTALMNTPVINSNPDAVQEFKVETNSYSAQYGRAAGGVFNVITRSGTNEWHGTVYDYLRNDALNANSFFLNRAGLAKAPFRFNQFGATVGGPVRWPGIFAGRRQTFRGRPQGRSFFFASYEGVRFEQGSTYVGTVPTPLQREGDFSETKDAQGRPIQIFDPLTTRRDPANPARFIRDPFPGNIVPRARWDAAATRMLDFIPRPNATGNPLTGVGNFVTAATNRVRKDTFSVRVDHHLNEAQQVTGRYSYDRTPQIRPNVYNNVASPTFGPQLFIRQNLTLEHTVTYSPTMVGSLLYGFTRFGNERRPLSFGFDITRIGLPASLKEQLYPPSFPAIYVTGMGGQLDIPNTSVPSLLGTSGLIRAGDTTHALLGHLTKVFRRHTLKVGGEGRLLRPNFLSIADSAIQFSFGPAFTQGPDPTVSSSAGFGFATFLLGVAGGSYNFSTALALQQMYWAAFIQDDVRLTEKLTLNIGLRYEYESPRTERYNRLTNFDAQQKPPLDDPGLDLRGALVFPGVEGRSRGQWEPDRNNFAPRVGLAYQITPKTVIRSGAGIFYAGTNNLLINPAFTGVSGFGTNTSVVTSLDSVTPTTFLNNPYPQGMNQPTGSRLGAATLLGESIRFVDRNNRTPYAMQWHLNVQRELLGGFLCEVGYSGARGVKLQEDLELNQLPEAALALGIALRDQVPNPFFGQILSGPLSARTVPRAQLLRPYPQFNSVVAARSTWAASSYHALIASAHRRFRQGLTLMASYTFSKLMDQSVDLFGGEQLGGTGLGFNSFQNFNRLRAERSISLLDVPHRLVINGVWSLPFGAGRRWLSAGPASALLSGWELSGIVTFQSGGPLGITNASPTHFAQAGAQRPDWTGISPQLPDRERSITHWINAAAFANPQPYTFGNAPRTFGQLRSDGLANVDASLVKNIRLGEKLTLQFRSEFFNLLNTPRFAPPNTIFGSLQFGSVTSQLNPSRVLQFALKLIY